MLVIDLFSGLNGWGDPWRERGHTVISADNVAKFGADYQESLADPGAFIDWFNGLGLGRPDVILASPPCGGFSVMNIGKNWTHDGQPKSDTARMSLVLVASTLEIIERLEPKFWVIENPMAKLRKLDIMAGIDRRLVTYCQYGEKRMKPTDLWGGFPPVEFRQPCGKGDKCHVSAPRGSRTGTQGMSAELSAKVPYELSLDICMAAESYIRNGGHDD